MQYDHELSRFFSMESYAMLPTAPTTDTLREVHKEFLASIRYSATGSRYEVTLPWKSNHKPLLNNIFQAKRRLFSLRRKFDRNPELESKYSQLLSLSTKLYSSSKMCRVLK